MLGWIPRRREWRATHSSILAWRSPWIGESDGLQSMGSERFRHNWAINTTLTGWVKTGIFSRQETAGPRTQGGPGGAALRWAGPALMFSTPSSSPTTAPRPWQSPVCVSPQWMMFSGRARQWSILITISGLWPPWYGEGENEPFPDGVTSLCTLKKLQVWSRNTHSTLPQSWEPTPPPRIPWDHSLHSFCLSKR